MLPARNRLRSSRDFTAAMRGAGRRKGSSTTMSVVLTPRADHETDPHPVRVGLVVSKGVGNSVVRSRVQRRLRHLVRPRLADLPVGHDLVIRAHPAAADADWDRLVQDLDRCLQRATRTGR